ncbi:ABC transporter ATP-binding protein [Terracoccus luteus]|uniref:ATP-binding cassette subfamily B protein n=1 Tax=Terracoccus luteus TaxID=53356 RepID=A0A495Y1L3_9MICO|nr:ABC transporter ATP-binding protein [Terracoccus luteus]MBB2986311.1 ATP-binding cassette subfamily B protein [Terracoccus luteus]MCP2172099.1 ATP-binding cassette subfamily B protein [Terracoccus luteus]RKT79064.1 ATP-binding cassette subfamily B protein [Terracoccus luteus]
MLIRLLRAHLRSYRPLVLLIVVAQFASTMASLYLPSLNGQIIDEGVAKGDTGFIVGHGGIMLAVSLVQIAASVAATYLAARVAMGMGRDIRARVFSRVVDFSAQEVTRFGAPTLISRTTNDVTQVQTVTFMAFALLVTTPIMMVGGIVMALREDVGLSWLVAVAVPLLGLVVGLVISRMVPWFGRMQTSLDGVNRVLREQITGIRVVRAFVREEHEEARFAEANGQLTNAGLQVGRLLALVFPIVMFIFNISTVAVMWFGGHRVDSGAMQIGELTAFLSYLVQILMAVMMATFMATMIPRAAVSSGRIVEVLDTDSSVVAPSRPTRMPVGAAGLAFRGVDFHYPGAEAAVLHDVSFEARPGRTTAVIGSTGAGKTTLVGLVPRLFDVSDGTVEVGGVDVRELELDDLWDRIGLVPQKPYLFSGTVASNLRYGNPEASDDELWEALRISQGEDFVRAMGGLDSPIAQGGTNVSGGQRQRLAIARAVVTRPDIYLFDDSFSALDLSTDARLRRALRPVTAASTVVIVAQRVSTIVDADHIVVLDDGRVVGQGTHDELLATCETYQEIVESQRSAEVAA